MLLVDAVAAAAGIGVSGTKGSKLVLAARAGALEKAVAKLISFFTGCKAERSSACTCTCGARAIEDNHRERRRDWNGTNIITSLRMSVGCRL